MHTMARRQARLCDLGMYLYNCILSMLSILSMLYRQHRQYTHYNNYIDTYLGHITRLSSGHSVH